MQAPTKFREIDFPSSYRYRSDSEDIPLQFYEDTFPLSKEIDLLLGYFSSNAFKILAQSFAEFISKGGKMRLITNHVYSFKDYEHLINHTVLDNQNIVIDIMQDVERFAETLSDYGQHFFDCLKYLMKQGRLQLLPVKFNEAELSHAKTMILFDGVDRITTEGSINFTLAALVKNSESFSVETPWNGLVSQRRIQETYENFNRIFSGDHPEYTVIDKNQIEYFIDNVGQDKNVKDLLDDSLNLEPSSFSEKVKKIKELKKQRFEERIQELSFKPKFPFNEPREYQKQAYKNWTENNYQGLFAMATGTGKTITSLNCILSEYNKTENRTYNFIVLVPTIALANQWLNEVEVKFNFQSVLVCSSGSNWEHSFQQFGKEMVFGIESDFCIIATYATFRGQKFQRILNEYFGNSLSRLTLIADEAHTFGAPKLLEVLPNGIQKRIGLSATPERVYDLIGQSELCKFFNSFPPEYTFSYNMQKAIQDEILCKYFYYPRFVDLVDSELVDYRRITKQLYRYIDSKTSRYKDLPEVTNLLIKRKSIIHKASNKLCCLDSIVSDIGADNFRYAFIYVPEGYESNYADEDIDQEDLENIRIIDAYAELLNDKFNLKLRKFLGGTTDRENVLDQFEQGKLDALLAMKCLDEGVDVPRAQYAIFCSSTGNPRQYVQRRGRILRRHDDKDHAHIYDMIVKPPIDITETDQKALNAEKGIFEGELRRLVNFAALAENKLEILEEINMVADIYDLDVYEMLNSELEKY